MENLKIKYIYNPASIIFMVTLLFAQACTQPDGSVAPENNGTDELENTASSSRDKRGKPQSTYNVNVTASETGADIYVDGAFTGKQTPSVISIPSGTHTIGAGLNSSGQYLKKTVEIGSSTQNVALSSQDVQAPKTWKALFVGVNQVTNGSCVTTYTTQQLDLAFDYFKWSFEEYVEPWTFNTMNWEFTRRDISDQVVQLSSDNLITPDVFQNYISDLNPGDYDLVVTFFRGEEADAGCSIASFIGIAWYDVTALYANSSYFTIRYHDDIEARIQNSMQNDPGVFIHEWLHTVAEMFYPARGIKVPSFRGEVVHSAEHYNYTWPWMTWYEDIIKGQVTDRNSAYGYVGICPEAYLECSVSESALGQCP